MTDKKVFKTSATKRIGRKIQPRQFESVDISIECQDEIEWSTIDERSAKLTKLTNLAINDFNETFAQVCEALGIEDKRAFVHNHGAKSAAPPSKLENKPLKSEGSSADDDGGMDIFDGI